MPKKPEPVMAKSISAVVCKHGSLYLRLHDSEGNIFAAASVDRATGFALMDRVLTEFSAPSADCDGIH